MSIPLPARFNLQIMRQSTKFNTLQGLQTVECETKHIEIPTLKNLNLKDFYGNPSQLCYSMAI